MIYPGKLTYRGLGHMTLLKINKYCRQRERDRERKREREREREREKETVKHYKEFIY